MNWDWKRIKDKRCHLCGNESPEVITKISLKRISRNKPQVLGYYVKCGNEDCENETTELEPTQAEATQRWTEENVI